MRRISVTHTRPDCMVVHVGRDRSRLVVWLGALAALCTGLLLLDLGSAGGLFVVFLAALIVPPAGVAVFRAARAQERTLVRSNNRLLLDGEPLEMARVELRVLKMPITRVPTGYALSLWVMAAAGPEDVPIGRFATLLEASALSGALEDFVQRANIKQHRLA